MKDALFELEPVLTELHATTGIIQHLASGHPEEVAEVEWSKLAGDLYRCSEKIDELWDRACDERRATADAHKAAIEAERAKKAAPGSKEDLRRADGLWALLRSLTEVVGRECAVSGYRIRLDRLEESYDPGLELHAPGGFVNTEDEP